MQTNMENTKRPAKGSEFQPHQFWVDNVCREGVETFWQLSEALVLDSMKANGFEDTEEGRHAFIEKWKAWYIHQTFYKYDFYERIAMLVYRDRKIRHNGEERPMKARDKQYVIYNIKKILEKYNQ